MQLRNKAIKDLEHLHLYLKKNKGLLHRQLESPYALKVSICLTYPFVRSKLQATLNQCITFNATTIKPQAL